VHHIDPVIGRVAGVYLWWYGLGYAAAFAELLLYLRRRRARLRFTEREVYALTLLFAAGALLGGRAVQIAGDEWPLYRARPWLAPALWLGGMATHGLLLGALIATLIFARVYRKPFLELADVLVIPGALLLGLGRIGNFIDGQIVGRVTGVWWAVKFPDAYGFRHPVVLYDGLKNVLLIPYLLHVRRTNPTPGSVSARFVFWYALLRIAIDLLRDYPTYRLALGTGQTLNILMATVGAVLLVRSKRRLGKCAPRQEIGRRIEPVPDRPASSLQRLAFACLVGFCLTFPSNWTQDVPARYGGRHPGMTRTWAYPRLNTSAFRR